MPSRHCFNALCFPHGIRKFYWYAYSHNYHVSQSVCANQLIQTVYYNIVLSEILELSNTLYSILARI